MTVAGGVGNEDQLMAKLPMGCEKLVWQQVEAVLPYRCDACLMHQK